MPAIRIISVFSLAACLAVAVQAQRGQKVELHHQWPVNTSRTYEVQTQTDIDDSTGAFQVTINFLVAESIEPAKETDGGSKVTRRIDELTLEINHPLLGTATLDTESGTQTGQPALTAPFQSLLGRESVWIFNAQGQLLAAEGSLEQAVSETGLLPGGIPARKPDPAASKATAQATLDVIPAKPVARGDTWSSTLRHTSAAGDLTISQTHRLARFDSRRNIAEIETQGRFQPSAGVIEIQDGSTTSTTQFDPERGVITRQTTTTSFEATTSLPGLPSETRRVTQTAEWKLRETRKSLRRR